MIENYAMAPVHFDELFVPSGQFGMRGFVDGRFRGLSGIVGTAEYRWYIAADFDATLFVDTGTAAGARFAGLEASNLFWTYGVGLRHVSPTDEYWLAAVADGVQFTYAPNDGFRLLFTLAGF